jgi:hypothetical protein
LQYALLLYEFLSDIRLFPKAVVCVVNYLSIGHVTCNLDLMMSVVVKRNSYRLLIIVVFFFVIAVTIVIRIIFCFIDVEDIVSLII